MTLQYSAFPTLNHALSSDNYTSGLYANLIVKKSNAQPGSEFKKKLKTILYINLQRLIFQNSANY